MGGGGRSKRERVLPGNSLVSIGLMVGELPAVQTRAGTPERSAGSLSRLKMFLSGKHLFLCSFLKKASVSEHYC